MLHLSRPDDANCRKYQQQVMNRPEVTAMERRFVVSRPSGRELQKAMKRFGVTELPMVIFISPLNGNELAPRCGLWSDQPAELLLKSMQQARRTLLKELLPKIRKDLFSRKIKPKALREALELTRRYELDQFELRVLQLAADTNQHISVRSTAIKTVAAIGSLDSLRRLARLLREPSVGRTVVQALKVCPLEKLIVLFEMLLGEDGDLRLAAARAIEDILGWEQVEPAGVWTSAEAAPRDAIIKQWFAKYVEMLRKDGREKPTHKDEQARKNQASGSGSRALQR